MDDADVLISGAGPTGLMLAAELALAGVRVQVLERRSSAALVGRRAGGLHARSLEVLDQRGVVERFLREGQIAQGVGFAFNRLDISDFPTRHNYLLALWQPEIERILAQWVAELDVPVLFGSEVVGLSQDAGQVAISLADGSVRHAAFLVGCDGGRSLVRKRAGIGFPGWDATTSNLIAEVEMTGQPEFGVHRNAFGLHSFGRSKFEIKDGAIVYADSGPVTVMVSEREVGRASQPTLEDLKAALIAACGSDYGIHSPHWISRFTDASRQAESYRKRRVLLAGDAAHIHGPQGGQGLNTGLQDAVNLGWKLGLVVKGAAPESLLDSYHTERHPVAARVLRNSMAQVALGRPDDRTAALRETMADMLAMDGPRRRIAGMLSGLDIAYDLGPGHPVLGRRMPDLDLVMPLATQRMFTLLHGARPVLLVLDQGPRFDIGRWAGRVEPVEARCAPMWDLPVIGPVPAPRAVLVRPDGHVAWAMTERGMGVQKGLAEALTRWFGPPASA